MDNRHEHLLSVKFDDLSDENREKYINDLVRRTGNEKDFDKAFELIEKYNSDNDVDTFEKMIQTDKLAQTIGIKGIDVANKVLENYFDKEYIEVWGIRNKPYEIAKHVNDFTTVKYQDAKEFAKLDLIEEKINDKFMEKFDELDSKVQSGEVEESKLEEFLIKEEKKGKFINETREDITKHVNREYLKEEFSECIKRNDIYDASKILEDNKEIFDEFDYDNMEKELGKVMDELLEGKSEEIVGEMERRDRVEFELMEEKENTNERLNNEQQENEKSGKEESSRDEYEHER